MPAYGFVQGGDPVGDDTSKYEVMSNQKMTEEKKNVSLRSKTEYVRMTSRGSKRGEKHQPGSICEDDRGAPERDQPCRSRQYPYPA